MKEIWQKYRKSIWGILLITGIISVPLMTDYCFRGDNLATVLSKIEAMGRGIGHVLPVRFGMLELQEYGYYGASFQPGVVYVFPALLHLMGVGMGAALKWSFFLLNLLTAFIAWICFQKITQSQAIGIVGSLLYTGCPYRCSEMYQMGNLEEIAGWAVLPVVLLGLWMLYQECEEKKSGDASWTVLALGLCLLTVSSTVVLSVGMILVVLTLLLMGRKTLQRRVLAGLGKAWGTSLAVGAWFLIPMLARMRDAQVVGPMIVSDFRSYGTYLIQYLTVFPRAGMQVRTLQNGMAHAQAIGPGIAAVLLAVLYLGKRFVGEDNLGGKHLWREALPVGRMLGVSVILLFLSSHLFPWDMLQDRNMLFSCLLALLCTPAKLAVVADAGLILVACLVLKVLQGNEEEEGKRRWLLAVLLLSFGTIQFQLGNIMITQNFVRQEEIALLSQTAIPLVEQESFLWRCCEGISVVAVCACAVLWVIRRHKNAGRIRVSQK